MVGLDMTALRPSHRPDAGFGYAIDAYTARRQLHLSLGVVMILVAAIVTAALSLDAQPVSGRGYVVSAPTATHQAERALPAFRS